MLKEYIKEPKKHYKLQKGVMSTTITQKKIGILVAFVPSETNEIHIGWSLCNWRDDFDRNLGLQIAESRVLYYLKYKDGLNLDRWARKVPHSIRPHVKEFAKRARKYYKQSEVADWIAYVN